MEYSATESWSDALTKEIQVADNYPAQGLIRAIRGQYPLLPTIPHDGSALDVGCGDGRNAAFLAESGFEVTGIEIAESIVSALAVNRPTCRFEVGFAHDLPREDGSVDLAIAWNSMYYMGLHDLPIDDHFGEIARVVRHGGALIASLPMPNCFIFADSTEAPARSDGTRGVRYRTIQHDPFGIRNGEVLATFESTDALLAMARRHFGDRVAVGTETGDWFGYGYNWWVLVAVK